MGFRLLCQMRLSGFFIILLALFTACSSKYGAFKNNYQFKSPDGKPDYSDLNYWAAHPWKWDPSDSVPSPLRYEHKDSLADVFFLHPTTYTNKKEGKLNADIDDDYINAKTDYSSILYQASVFNNQCRVFAPRYRQAHIKNFFSKDKNGVIKAFDLAYEDLKSSFDYYLKNWNNGRLIIIAAHSQGSLLAERLLKEYFDISSGPAKTSLQKKLVVAYIIGWPVAKDYFTSLKMCEDSLQTGCICSWRTLRKGFIPSYLKNDPGNSYVTNPLTWKSDNEYASRKLNKGSVLTKFNTVFKKTTDAQVDKGFLYVNKPKFPWSFLYFTRNYHIADINLYYLNIRENVTTRIEMFRKNN